MIEDDADEQEQAEAEALARALEGAAASSTPGEALETASLLRAVAQPSELSQARADAVLAGLSSTVAKHVKPQRSRTVVWIAASSLAAAAAIALYLNMPREHADTRASMRRDALAASDLPVPAPTLLAAQSALSSSGAHGAERATFEREMRAYRERMLSKLKRSYPTMVGMLEAREAK